mgnify:CR=1 FL=1
MAEQFFEQAAAESKLVLLDFGAEWCSTCKIVDSLLEKAWPAFHPRLLLVKLDIHQRPDLVELVPLEGGNNKGALDETARAVAEGVFGRPDRVEAAKYSVARPWPVNTDGVVAGVEIAMRPNGKGFVTTIHVGSDAPAIKPLDRTRVRVRRGAASDGAAREGLLP